MKKILAKICTFPSLIRFNHYIYTQKLQTDTLLREGLYIHMYVCGKISDFGGGGVQFESTLIWLEKKGLLEITIFDNHL